MHSFRNPAPRTLPRRSVLRGASALALGAPFGANLRAGRAAPPAALIGVVWQWQATVAADGSIRWQPDRPERYTLTFAPDGTLAIQADCNRARGVYSVDGATVDLKIGAVTRMRCAADSMMEQFLGGLEYAAALSVQPDDLALTLDGGAVMRFAPAGSESGSATPAAD